MTPGLGLCTGDPDNSNILTIIFGPSGYESEEEEKKEPIFELQPAKEDEDEHDNTPQDRKETHDERMKRIAETCDRERKEKKPTSPQYPPWEDPPRKKPKLEMEV